MSDNKHPIERQDGEVSPSHRILVTLMGSIGDVARGLTLVPRIKRHWPHARVTWVVEPKSEGLVRLSTQVDRVVVFPRAKGLQSQLDFVKELRRERYDVALDLQRHAKSALVTWLSRCPRRIGFARANAKEGNWLLSTERIRAFDEDLENKGEVYQRFLDLLEIPRTAQDYGSELSLGNANLPASKGLRSKNYVVCVMGSSWESKNWLASGYLSLGQKLLAETSHSLVLVGDRSQIELAGSVAAALSKQGKKDTALPTEKSARVVDMVAQTSLEELVGLLAESTVVVGPDSGPGHIAAGLGVPVVGLFGPTSSARTAPIIKGSQGGLQNQVAVLSASLGCSPCYRRVCPGLNRVCMRLISPEAVFDALRPYIVLQNDTAGGALGLK